MNSGGACIYDRYSPCDECGRCIKHKGVTVIDEKHDEIYETHYISDDGGLTWDIEKDY